MLAEFVLPCAILWQVFSLAHIESAHVASMAKAQWKRLVFLLLLGGASCSKFICEKAESNSTCLGIEPQPLAVPSKLREALASVNEDASAPSTKPTELRAMPHWLVRPHGAVVEPRGRQRVKVPKRGVHKQW
eukprot:symbB.v1.2.024890.t1/scaffold2388.1/size114014/7